MKVLVFSDLQATEGHERCHANSAVPLQRWRVTKFFDDLLAVYREHHCEALWDLGDLLDDRSAVPVPTIEVVLAGLAKFPRSKHGIKLVGNHEQHHRGAAMHSGRMFAPFFSVVSATTIFSVGGRKVVACGFPENDAAAAAWLAENASRDAIVLGHFQVSGCRMSSGLAIAGIPAAALAGYGLGLLGHVHSRQPIAGTSAFYVGSPFQQDFGESGDDKFVAVVDTATLAVEWVTLPGFPKYQTVDLDGWAGRGPEDRCKVVLASPAEAAQFYAAPACGQAEPVYSYELGPGPAQEGETPLATDIEGLMRDYARLRPPSQVGVELPEAEFLAIGKDILAQV